jgi:hypothetical protein
LFVLHLPAACGRGLDLSGNVNARCGLVYRLGGSIGVDSPLLLVEHARELTLFLIRLLRRRLLKLNG